MRGGSALIQSQRLDVIHTYERERAKGAHVDEALLKNLRSIHTDCLEDFDRIDRQHAA